MDSYSIAEAKAQLSELVRRAERGRQAVITRHGKPVARVLAIVRPHGPGLTVDQLRRKLKKMPKLDVSTAEIVRQMRDED